MPLFQYQRWSFLLGLVLYYLLLRTIWFIGLTKQLQSCTSKSFWGQGWLLKLDYVHFKLIMHCASPYNSFWIQKPCLKYIFNIVASSIFSVNRNILCATGLAWIIAAYGKAIKYIDWNLCQMISISSAFPQPPSPWQ